MAEIIVVKTCDGDVYFKANKTQRSLAVDLAARQVTTNDLASYDEEDREAVREARYRRDWPALYKLLIECGAIKERDFFR